VCFFAVLVRSRERALASLGEFVESSGKNLEKSVAVERGFVRGKKIHGNDACGNELQLKYLRKIVDLTRGHGAEIIFLNPPLYRAREFFDVDFFEKRFAKISQTSNFGITEIF